MENNMEESDNDPHRRELNYSKAYRKKYEEKFGGKKINVQSNLNRGDKFNSGSNGRGDKDKLSGNQRGNGVGEKDNVQSNLNRSKDNLNQKVNGVGGKDNVQSNINRSNKDVLLGRESEPIVTKIEETLGLKRGPRWEKILIACIYGIVGLVILYFILASFFPQVFNVNTYTIDAKDNTFLDSLSSFYIDSNVLEDKEVIGDKTVRIINSARPFNLVFKPKTKTTAQNGLLELNFILNGTGSNIYLDNKLVFPNLENYNLAYESDDDFVYVRSDLDDLTNWNVSVATSEDFIYNNFPSSGVWSTRVLNPVDVKLDDYAQENTLINTTFRDNLKLAVYAEGNLNINFTKQDLNGYLGQDEYTVNITDQSGNVIFSQVYADDGDKLASSKRGKEQSFEINIPNLKNGVYYVSFLRDNYNSISDSTLKNIKINSNKIVFIGTILPITPFDFYTKSNFQKTIAFSYWHIGKDQIISISGDKNENINLSTDWINKNYGYNLTEGEYNFKLEKGDLWVYSDIISPTKANWFNIPFKQDETFNNQDILVISKQTLDDFGNLKISKEIIDSNFGANVRILDANKVYFEKAKLSLYN